MRPEDKLLCLCARTDIASGGFTPLITALVSPRINWDYLYQKACAQQVAPLLYKTLSKIESASSLIPASIYLAMRENYYYLCSLNLIYLGHFQKVVNALREEGVKFLAFKGLLLGEMAYRDIGLRKSSDMDILIHPEDIIATDRLLRKLGYASDYTIKDKQDIRCNRYRNSLLYMHEDKTILPVHLYWHWVNLVSADPLLVQKIDMQAVWSKALEITLPGGITVATFAPQHQLIYLALHGLSHGFANLSLLCDINELILRDPSAWEWDALKDEACRFGLRQHLYYALFFCRELLDTPVPAGLLDALKPGKISRLEKRFMASVLSGSVSPTEEFLMYLGMNETFAKRIFFLWGALFPAKPEMALIRQKDLRDVNIIDYLKRLDSALKCALRSGIKYLH